MSRIQARVPAKDLGQGLRHGKKGRIRKALATAACVTLVGTVALRAQSQGVLARAQIVSTGENSCPVLLVNFNQDLLISGQSTSADGQSLVVRLADNGAPLTKDATTDQIETQPGLTVPGLGTAFVTLDISGDSPVMNIRFSAAPTKMVITQAGSRSVVISLFDDASACATDSGPSSGAEALPDAVADAGVGEAAGKAYAEARTAVTAGDYDKAVQLLTEVLSMAENPYSADSQELLGIARERNGQTAHAKAEYEIYLRKYPDGEGAERVRQRLQAILTAEAAPPADLKEPTPGLATDGTKEAVSGATIITSIPRRDESFPPLRPQPGPAGLGPIARLGDQILDSDPAAVAARKTRDRVDDPPQISVTLSYYLNESTTLITELEDHTTESETDILQNAAVVSFNVSDSFRRGGNVYSYRFNGDYQQDFTDGSDTQLNLGRFYGEIALGDGGLSIAIGRQSWHDDASLGRYDGVRLRGNLGDDLQLTAVAGKGVDRKSDPMFGSDSTVLGLSVGYLGFGEDTEISAFALRETVGGFTDRLVLGAEASHSTDASTLTGMFEYDLNFGKLSRSRANWSHRFQDSSSLSFTAEYDHSPTLSLSSALVGQFVDSLGELSAIYTPAEIEQLALDRSSETLSFSGAWQKPMGERWQFSVDASAYHAAGSPASGSVPEVESPGWSYQASAQVVGTGIAAEDDVLSLALRVAKDNRSDLLLLDGYWRFSLGEKLRLRPRLKLADRTFADGTGSEVFAIPSLTMNYELSDSKSFELEVGGRLSNRDTPGISEETNDVYLNAGLTMDF